MKEKKEYWQGLEQIEGEEKFQKNTEKEFPEYLPLISKDGVASRRDFLKLMGFGTAAVSLAACETPIRKAIPYVNKPEDIDPGIPNYYASTYAMGNDYCSVVVKTREGRPIKIEGNTMSNVSLGKTSTQAEASILSLYDEQRFKNPQYFGEDTNWDSVDNDIKLALSINPGKITIVSYSNCSPSTLKAIELIKEKFGTLNHIQYDPVSSSALMDAYLSATGTRTFPKHNFSKADTIVAIDSDFLNNWPNRIEASQQFAQTRKLHDSKKTMSRLYAFEANLSLTGANADYRQPIAPSQVGHYVAYLYHLIAQKAGITTIPIPKPESNELIKKAANDLWRTKGKSLVVCSNNDIKVQLMVIAINQIIRCYGNTIDMSRSYHTMKGNDSAFAKFVNDIHESRIGTLIFLNCNPIYDHPLGKSLVSALGKVKTIISSSNIPNETSEYAHYIVPDHHYLESWNDFEPITGHLSLSQPTINPIFNTRQIQESILKWTDLNTTYYDFLRDNWKKYANKEFETFWNQCLHDGVFETQVESVLPTINVDIATVLQAVQSKINKSTDLELDIYANNSISDGIQANNPWLQEMPDPITKACWGNYVTVSPKQAKENGWNVNNGDMDCKVAILQVQDTTIEVPILVQPGQAYGTIGLALGYGRSKGGLVAEKLGVNAYQLIDSSSKSLKYSRENVTLKLTDKIIKVPQTQTSHTYAGRKTVIQEATLSEYQKDPLAGRNFTQISSADGEKLNPYAVSLWKGHKYPNHHWGMIVDINSCIGCGTCTIACQTENNIPVVGKDEVINRREMHWIRIDRYYSERPEEEKTETDKSMMEVKQKELAAQNPEVTFQPMMCQQCNNAPCESVCPVAATTHSSEGLNQMTYNRCIGTRYCANNCPYKVRRFNWFKYHDNEQFDVNTAMNNDLGKMVLNPDVTVRSRGVMEKCTFCVQRIQAGKLHAKKENRRPVDGEIATACVKACPTDALVFGDMKDKNSKIYKTLKLKEQESGVTSQEPRAFHVLEELRVMPNVWYLTKIRNKDKNSKV